MSAWRKWFFAKGGGETAALLRIIYAVIFLFMLWDIHPVLDQLFGHDGVFGTLRPEYHSRPHPAALLFHFDSPLALAVWHAASVLLCLTMLVGFRSRIATVLVYFSLMSMQFRNPWINYGADDVMKNLGLWLCFLDTGNRWSVDAWLKGRRNHHRPAEPIELWPVRVIQLQVALLYLWSFIAKMGTVPWRDGSAVFYALQSRDCGHDLFPWVLDQKLGLTLLTYGTLVVEGLLPVLAFSAGPARWAILLAGVGLHAGIDVLMHIRFFSLTMYLGYASFLRPEELRRWVR